MDLIRRIGTVRHRWKMQIFMEKVTLSKKWAGNVYINKGNHKRNTTQQIPISPQLQCNFNKQTLTFEALTLFFDQDDQVYLEKPGEMKVILRANSGDKKLLGIVGFDVAELPNAQNHSGQHFKKTLTETPNNLTGSISYQMYVKYLGEGGESAMSEEPAGLKNTLTAMKGSAQQEIVRPEEVELATHDMVSSQMWGSGKSNQKVELRREVSGGTNLESTVREYMKPQTMTEEDYLFPQNTTLPSFTDSPTKVSEQFIPTSRNSDGKHTEKSAKRDSGKNNKKVKETTLFVSPQVKKQHHSVPIEPSLPVIIPEEMTSRVSELRDTQRRESRITSVSKAEDYLDEELDDMFGDCGQQKAIVPQKDIHLVASPTSAQIPPMAKKKQKEGLLLNSSLVDSMSTLKVSEDLERQKQPGELKKLRQQVERGRQNKRKLEEAYSQISSLKEELRVLQGEYAKIGSELQMLRVQQSEMDRQGETRDEELVLERLTSGTGLEELKKVKKERNQLLVLVDQLKSQQLAREKRERESQVRVAEEQEEENQRLRAEVVRGKQELRKEKEEVKRWMGAEEKVREQNESLNKRVEQVQQYSNGLQMQLTQLKINMGQMMNALSEQGRHSVVMALTNLNQN